MPRGVREQQGRGEQHDVAERRVEHRADTADRVRCPRELPEIRQAEQRVVVHPPPGAEDPADPITDRHRQRQQPGGDDRRHERAAEEDPNVGKQPRGPRASQPANRCESHTHRDRRAEEHFRLGQEDEPEQRAGGDEPRDTPAARPQVEASDHR
jgi:hypothetical protein